MLIRTSLLLMKFGTDIPGSQSMNPSDAGDFSTSAALRISYDFGLEFSQLLDGFWWNVVQTFMFPRGWIVILAIP